MDKQIKSFRLIDIKEVSKKVSLGRTTILSWESETKFPTAIRLSPGKRVWLEADVDSWIISHRNASQNTPKVTQ